jgi:TPR repeat protein
MIKEMNITVSKANRSRCLQGFNGIIFLCLFFFCCSLATQAQEYCDKAQQAFRQGDYSAAEKNYRNCRTANNINVDSEIARARECKSLKQEADSYFDAGDYQNALRQYNALLSKNPADPTAKSRKAICRTKLDETRIANDEWQRAEQQKAEKARRAREAAEAEAQRQRDWQAQLDREKKEAAEAEAQRQRDLQAQRERESREAEAARKAAEQREQERKAEEQRRLDETARREREAAELNEQGKACLARKNYYEALRYFLLSAKIGFAAAENNAGYMYELGLGIDRNLYLAVDYYEKSAGKGFARAQYNLARLYESGKGVKKNPLRALNLYQQAAEQGLQEADIRIKEISK